MKQLRKMLSLLLILSTLLSLAALTGCHGNKGLEPFVMPESFDEAKQYEITFWAKNDTNILQTKVYQKAISDFEALYPNIKVNLHLYTDYGKIYNDVITNIATQTTPNVCITYPDHIATYLSGSNVVVPLSALFDDQKYGFGGSALRYEAPAKEEIVPEFLEEGKIGDEYYAIPFMRSSEVCYVNRDLVEKLGYELPEMLTWDFVWEVSEAAMEKDADGNFTVNGQKVMIPFIYKSTDNMMIQMLRQRGAGYSTDDAEIEIFNEDTEEILKDIAALSETGAFSTFKISSYPGNFLNAGQCIFAVDSTAGATWMGTDAPNMDIAEDKVVDFEMAVLPVPQYDTENPQMISQGPSVCIFNKSDSGEVLASWLFAQYLLTDEVQLTYSSTEGYVPVTLKAQESAEYLEYLSLAGTDCDKHYDAKIKASEILKSYTDCTFTTSVFKGSASLRDAAGQLIENTVKAVRRKEVVDDAFIEDLFKDVTALYRLDQISLGKEDSGEKQALGELPATSKGLLFGLAAVWAGIGVYALRSFVIKKREERKRY